MMNGQFPTRAGRGSRPSNEARGHGNAEAEHERRRIVDVHVHTQVEHSPVVEGDSRGQPGDERDAPASAADEALGVGEARGRHAPTQRSPLSLLPCQSGSVKGTVIATPAADGAKAGVVAERTSEPALEPQADGLRARRGGEGHSMQITEELSHDEPTLALENPGELTQRGCLVGHLSEGDVQVGGVEGPVGVRQGLGIAAGGRDVRDSGCGSACGRASGSRSRMSSVPPGITHCATAKV